MDLGLKIIVALLGGCAGLAWVVMLAGFTLTLTGAKDSDASAPIFVGLLYLSFSLAAFLAIHKRKA